MLFARRVFHQAVAPSFPSFLFQPFLVRSGRRRLLASAKSCKMKLNSVDGRGLLPIRRLGPTGLAKVAQSPTVGPVRFVANLGDALFERDVLFHFFSPPPPSLAHAMGPAEVTNVPYGYHLVQSSTRGG